MCFATTVENLVVFAVKEEGITICKNSLIHSFSSSTKNTLPAGSLNHATFVSPHFHTLIDIAVMLEIHPRQYFFAFCKSSTEKLENAFVSLNKNRTLPVFTKFVSINSLVSE